MAMHRPPDSSKYVCIKHTNSTSRDYRNTREDSLVYYNHIHQQYAFILIDRAKLVWSAHASTASVYN